MRATAVAMTEVNNAAATACCVHTPSMASRMKSVEASGTLYTAAKPAPEAQAISSRISSSSKPNRLPPAKANAAVISRGATSRPSGEPSPTVMICSRTWKTVVRNGSPCNGCFKAALISICGLPKRLSNHQPPPANIPHRINTPKRRPSEARATPSRNEMYAPSAP